MTETTHEERQASEQSRSALGRLTLLVEAQGGTEQITYERRWPDARSARVWCEQKVREAPPGAAVLEIQVTEGIWGRRNSWDATASRHVPETLQLGLRTRTGTVAWGSAHDVGTAVGRQRRG